MEIKSFTKDIDKFILDLDISVSSKVNSTLLFLREFGNNLSLPYSKALGDGLFELRISGKVPVRIIYCFYENNVILLHIFIKKQNKIPIKELDLAKKRKSILHNI